MIVAASNIVFIFAVLLLLPTGGMAMFPSWREMYHSAKNLGTKIADPADEAAAHIQKQLDGLSNYVKSYKPGPMLKQSPSIKSVKEQLAMLTQSPSIKSAKEINISKWFNGS